MSNYWTGYQMGQQAAETQNSAANLGHAFARALTGIPQAPSLRQQLDAVQDELQVQMVGRTIARATVSGMQAVIAALSPSARAEVERAMATHFDKAFVQKAGELGLTASNLPDVIPKAKAALLPR